MTLVPGTKLGPYEILSPLGAGGMGEVYRARDPRLGRDVAIKALPTDFAQDPERMARFEREARLLATLSHPNVAGIHGLEEANGAKYLVLEFVDGETLAARLARGALPLDETIAVATQIAGGVEAAHENGVIHRDLKPGNVIVMPNGQAKVLDFGLATSSGATAAGSDPNLSHSPTLSHHATRAGVILGTAAYMSPEQARGKAVDRRTDIWSFGCIVFECLTGRQLHEGETVSDLIARILEREPDWTALPADTPPRLREMLKRCLRKDPKERIRDIGDARLELEAIARGETGSAAATAVASGRSRMRAWPWMIATGVLLGALIASFVIKPGGEETQRRALRVAIPLPPGLTVTVEPPDMALSPDGGSIVFVASDTTGMTRLYERRLDAAVVRAIPGTERALLPFWSPDSRQIAFFADGNLKRMGVDGSGAQVISPAPSPRGGAWGPNDVIVFQPNATGVLVQIPATGGTPAPATILDETRNETGHRFPSFLPDGNHFLYVALPGKNGIPETRVGSVDVELGPLLLESLSIATYAPPGYLLFNQNESVVAQPFDATALKLSGKPQLVPDFYNTAVSYSGSPILTASRDGKLVQRELNLSGYQLQVLDRRGRLVRRLGIPAGSFGVPAFSPDQTRLAVAYSHGTEYEAKVWLIDLQRDLPTRLSFAKGYDTSPLFTRDGLRVVWGSDLESGRELFWKRADGSGSDELFADVPNLFNDPTSITSRFVVFQSLSGTTNLDLWMVPLEGEHVPQVLMQTPFDEAWATVSPDERWMAYRSNESGRDEIYVVSFPDLGQKTRVSNAGTVPSQQNNFGQIGWRSDGRELYYVAEDRRTIMAVPVETGATFRSGAPKALFRCSREVEGAYFAPDGQSVLANVPAEPNVRSILNLGVDWSAGLQSTTR